MKYIIMCGGTYPKWGTPRQLIKVGDETIVERTIRLLRENGVEDISISSNNPVFDQFGVPVLHHENGYSSTSYNHNKGYWCDCFYPTDEPTTYLFGDVIYSSNAIRIIMDTETDDIMFFGSKPPFSKIYPKRYEEPFAFKVVNTDHLKEACRKVKELDKEGKLRRQPIAWEVWNVITGGDPNRIDFDSFVGINDYTCDIDYPSEVDMVMKYVKFRSVNNEL